MNKFPVVAVIGSGSLGIMYGSFFEDHLPKENFYFAEDAVHLAKHRKQSFSLNGKTCHFVFKTPEEISAPPDLIMVAVKASGLPSATETVKAIAGEDTVIISVLNGISSEEYIESHIDKGTVIPCIAQKMDALNQNGAVISGCFGELCIGISKKESHKQKALEKLVRIFDDLEMPYVLEDDIQRRMWCKWMLNVGVNQVLMVEDGIFADIQKEGEKRNRMIGAMREVLALAQAEGIGMTEEDFETYLSIIDHLNPSGMPSMRQDRLAKRKSEVDFFAGTVLSRSKKQGLSAPVNQSLYDEVQKIESLY